MVKKLCDNIKQCIVKREQILSEIDHHMELAWGTGMGKLKVMLGFLNELKRQTGLGGDDMLEFLKDYAESEGEDDIEMSLIMNT